MLTNPNFGKRLSTERKRLRMTQADFAEACGVKPASQFLYERGDRTPNAKYLSKAAKVGVHIGYLFQGDSAKYGTNILATDDLVKIFVECDTKCRDTNGRLQDLEHRIKYFRDSIEKCATLATKKLKDSA